MTAPASVHDPALLPVLLRPSDFARVAQVSPRTIRRLVRLGIIRAVRIGKSVRIPPSELVRLSTPWVALEGD